MTINIMIFKKKKEVSRQSATSRKRDCHSFHGDIASDDTTEKRMKRLYKSATFCNN